MRSPVSRIFTALFGALFLAGAVWVAYQAGRRAREASSAPVVAAIRKIAQLATVEIQVSDVVRYEEIKTLVVFDFPKSATLRLRGRVLGGFDLSGSDFVVETDSARRIVRVRLPPPRLLAVDPRFEWFDEKDGWINPITPADRNRWMLWARGTLGRAARDAGLDRMAAEHARELLVAAALAMGWNAEVSVAGAAPTAMPAPVVTPAGPG
jgi:hypothetical protein